MPFDTDLPPDGADERPIRVSIVDDDPFALRMLRSYLDSSPRIEVLSTFTSASDVLPFLRRMRHDVLITDMRMPGMNGLELLTRVKKESPDVAVIVLTSFDDDSTMLNALAQHASGFLLKDASPDEVVRAVIAAHRGGTTISPVSASSDLPAPASAAERRRIRPDRDGGESPEPAVRRPVQRRYSRIPHRLGIHGQSPRVAPSEEVRSILPPRTRRHGL